MLQSHWSLKHKPVATLSKPQKMDRLSENDILKALVFFFLFFFFSFNTICHMKPLALISGDGVSVIPFKEM